MRKQSLIALGIAVALALVAVFLVNSYLGSAEKNQQVAQAGTVKVAVAQVPLAFGVKITPEKVRLVDWPQNSIPAGAFRSLAEINPVGKNFVALRPMEAGEPILRSKLSGEGGRATLSALLPAEMRAAAIRITDVAGVAGFVLPGDRVDVILTRPIGGDSPEQISDTLLQDIRVIAIDQEANDKTDKPVLAKTATLEVQPFDAQKLALAQSVGQLSLALRPISAEPGAGYLEAVSTSDLRGGTGTSYARASGPVPAVASAIRGRAPARVAPRAVVKPGGYGVEIIRGVVGSSYEVGGYVQR